MEFGWELFQYGEGLDCCFCPNGKRLELHGVGRSAIGSIRRDGLSPLSDGAEPQEDRKVPEMTPKGVFFLAFMAAQAIDEVFCQQLQVETHFDGFLVGVLAYLLCGDDDAGVLR